MMERVTARCHQLARRVRRAVSPGAVVLLYHRIVDLSSDPFNLCVTPRHFAEHLEVIRSWAQPARLTDVATFRHAGRVPRRSVIVTMDDGYFDAYTEAKPLLERYEIPATVFVTSGIVGSSREFWWDELERLVFQGEASGRQERFRSLYDSLLRAPEIERTQVMSDLAGRAAADLTARPSHRGLEPAELAALPASGLIEVGAHTVMHRPLATVARETQRQELAGSKRELERITGRPVVSFSFPHGSHSPDAVAEVERAGFQFACTSNYGLVRAGTSPLQLPRISVRNWDKSQFAHKLKYWLQG